MPVAQTLETFLSDREACYTVERHAASITSLETARRARIDEASLAKSVVLEDERGFVLAVVPASCRLDLTRLRKKLGRNLQMSREFDMARLFPDCVLGAIPPLGAAYGLATVIDVGLEDRDEVFFEGGDHETLIRMAGGEFLGLVATASIAEITYDRTSLKRSLAHRGQLWAALNTVRRAAGTSVGDGASWRDNLGRAVDRLATATQHHIDETERSDGLLEEIAREAPRLWRSIEKLRSEHDDLTSGYAHLKGQLEESASPLSIRRRVHRLLARYEAHRHRGADLVYEAFGVDIGGG